MSIRLVEAVEQARSLGVLDALIDGAEATVATARAAKRKANKPNPNGRKNAPRRKSGT